MRLMPTYTDPNVSVYDGPDRILQVPFAAGTIFARRGGKAVDLHHRFQSATANSSFLAGFAEVDVVGLADGHPESVADGDELPVNFAKEKSCVFPTSGGVLADDTHIGKEFDVYVDAAGLQYVNLNGHTHDVLRVSRLVTADGLHVSCVIPDDRRFGSI